MKRNKKKKWFKFVSKEPIGIYYASYTPDGKVWCSGKNPFEVIGLSKHIEGVRYTILEYYEGTDGDQPWAPPEEVMTDHRTLEYASLVDEEDEDT